MPRIERIRVTNIQYDDGKKQIPDVILDLNADDSVVLLGNGGGKTLLLQLIMQTVLPNEPLGGRRISDLLQSQKYTGHVVVEWLLDSGGTDKHYLCTGFCFSHSPSQNEGLRYFTYLFDYQKNGSPSAPLSLFGDDSAQQESPQLTIETLPLLVPDEAGRMQPNRYQEFKDFLRNNEATHIQVFDQINIYQEQLRMYHILPEEWKSIRDTNGSEGGVDKFFGRSKSTGALMENLLIPSVEQVIFDTERKKQELMQAFAQYRSTLLEIPTIQQNLKDFAVIRDHADIVVSAVYDLDQIQAEYDRYTTLLLQLAKTFYQESEDAKLAKTEQELKQQRISEELDTLNWKKASYQVFLKHQRYLELLKTQQVQEELCHQAQEKLEQVQRLQQEIEALDYYNQWQRAKAEIVEHQTQLKLMDQDQPELQLQLEQAKGKLRFSWQQRQGELDGRQKQLETQNTDLNQQLITVKATQKEQSAIQLEWQQDLANINSWLEQYKSKQHQVQAQIPNINLLDPTITQTQYQEEHADTIETIATRRQEITELETKRTDLEDLTATLDRALVQKQANLEQIDEKIAAYRLENEKLSAQLGQYRIFAQPLVDEQDEVNLKVRNLWQQARDERAILQTKVMEQQEKWALIADRDYYIAHHDLLTIQQHLERYNIPVVLGSEWLQAYDLSEADKVNLTKKYPLLAFGFVVDQNQVPKVKVAMKSLSNLRDFPVVFIIRQELANLTSTETDNMIQIGADEVYVYNSNAMAIYTSKQEFSEYKQSFAKHLSDLKEDLNQKQAAEAELTDLRSMVSQFFTQYSKSSVENLNNQQQSLQKGVKELEARKIQTKKNLDELSSQLVTVRQNLEDLQGQKFKLDNDIILLGDFISWFEKYANRTEQEHRLRRDLVLISRQIEQYQEEQEAIYKQQVEITSQIREVSHLLTEHSKDWQEYRLVDVLAQDTDETYDTVKQTVKAIELQLNSKQQERSNLQRLLTKAEEDKERTAEEIEQRQISFTWLEANIRTVTKTEIKQARDEVEAQAAQWKIQDQAKQKTERDSHAAHELWQNEINGVQTLYQEEPYIKYSSDNHLIEYQYVLDKLKINEQQLIETQNKISQLAQWYTQTWEAYEVVNNRFPELKQRWERLSLVTENDWQEYGERPTMVISVVESRRSKLGENLNAKKRTVEVRYRDYLSLLEATKNPRIRQFIRDVQAILAEQRLFNYEFVQDQFLRIFEALDAYRVQYTNTLAECEKNFTHLVNLCWRRAITVYESVSEIPKNSRIQLYERDLQVIRMDWKTWDDNDQLSRMEQYLRQVLQDLQNWKEQGIDDDEIDRKMEELLRTRNLVNVIAPITDCRITVFKPRKESIVRNHKIEYAPWDEVARWSGGEEYSIYITMFMIILTHIRQQTQGTHGSWKVLAADNPFGKASSAHILDTVFQVAKANRIQLLCFTAHKEDAILRYFPVVYSLQLRNAYGREVMKAEQLESGFYRVG